VIPNKFLVTILLRIKFSDLNLGILHKLDAGQNMENHVFILHEKVPVQRPGLQEIAGTYIPAHHVRQFQPLGFSENLMPISISRNPSRCGKQNARRLTVSSSSIVDFTQMFDKMSAMMPVMETATFTLPELNRQPAKVLKTL